MREGLVDLLRSYAMILGDLLEQGRHTPVAGFDVCPEALEVAPALAEVGVGVANRYVLGAERVVREMARGRGLAPIALRRPFARGRTRVLPGTTGEPEQRQGREHGDHCLSEHGRSSLRAF